MNTLSIKKEKKKKALTVEERAALYIKDPVFVKKKKEAKEFLKKAGLPNRYK
jgi:hypothetical protein